MSWPKESVGRVGGRWRVREFEEEGAVIGVTLRVGIRHAVGYSKASDTLQMEYKNPTSRQLLYSVHTS